MKRLLFLGDAGSAHLTKWVLALHGKYFEVAVFSLSEAAEEIRNLEGLSVYVRQTDKKKFSASLLSKFDYLSALPELKAFAKQFNPDIVHAHYASSYGLMAARLKRHPLIISAWGSDVFAFGDNPIGRNILKYNFKRADKILSTSYVMKERIKQFTKKDITISPFGVDANVFFPKKSKAPFFPKKSFVFGLIKSMEEIYGVEELIRAFDSLVKKGHDDIYLLLVGSGSKSDFYKKLCQELRISDRVHFAGRISHREIPTYHQMIDVFINPSYMESFGVSVLEAMACEKPVIVSNSGGLREIVSDGKNGLFVLVKDVESLAEKMERLYLNEDLQKTLAVAARESVIANYSWEKSVEIMVHDVYDSVLNP